MTNLVRLARGLWVPADSVIDFPARAAALLSSCPDGTVVAGLSAAVLHGLWLPATDEDQPVEVIVHRDITLPRDRCASRRRELRARRRVLPPEDIDLVDGIPVINAARTWVELGEFLQLPDLVAAGDCALRGKATMDELADMIGRFSRRRGVARARAALPFLDARSESRPESHLRYALVNSGRLPAPAVNVSVFDLRGQWLAVPDLSYEAARLALEYNGADHFTQRRGRKDITRAFDVDDRGGWRTLTFGPAEVFGRPAQVVRYVEHVYAERLEGVRRRPHPR